MGMQDGKLRRPLIELAHLPEVNHLSGFGVACDHVTKDELVQRYQAEMQVAPRRAVVGRPYLASSRQGIPSTGEATNQVENHLALAIFNDHRESGKELQLPSGEQLLLLDYQIPLNARKRDVGVGKVDLLGRTTSGRTAIIELKAAGGKDTPLRALLEGLAYAAILQANLTTLRAEVQKRFGLALLEEVPVLIVMAPEEYWRRFRSNPATGNWLLPLRHLMHRIEESVGVRVSCLEIKNSNFTLGVNRTRPKLHSSLSLYDVFEKAASSR